MVSRSVYLKGSPVNVGEEVVRGVASRFGCVTEVTVPADKDFCFVEYETPEDAKTACEAGTVDVGGTTVTIEMRKGPRRPHNLPEGTSHSIYIQDVPAEITQEAIFDAFAPYGAVVGSQFRNSLDGRRYAFVEFENSSVVANVVKASPFNISGHSIDVEERHSVGRARAPREHREGERPRRERDGNGEHREGGGRRGGRGRGRGGRGGDRERRDNRNRDENNGEGRENNHRGGNHRGGDRDDAPRGRLGSPPVASNSVYIRGFGPDTQESAVRAEFEQYGEIKSIIVRVKKMKDEEIRTWAFVEYVDANAVEEACEMTSGGLVLGGEDCTVEARKSEPKLFTRNRGGGRGGRGGFRRRGGRGSPRSPRGGNNHNDA